MNPFLLAYSQSDLFGKGIIIVLVLLSMLSWIVLLHKLWIMKHIHRLSALFKQIIEGATGPLLTLDVAMFPPPKRCVPHPFQAIYHSAKSKTIDVLNKNRHYIQEKMGKAPPYLTPSDLELLDSHVTATLSAQHQLLEKNLFVLSTIVTLAPFMGLLGTVWGILVTFAGLHSGGSVSANSVVLSGISTALVTTVMGLVIAIPALIAYNYLKASIRSYAADMDDFSTQLLVNIELQYRKVE